MVRVVIAAPAPIVGQSGWPDGAATPAPGVAIGDAELRGDPPGGRESTAWCTTHQR